MGGITLSPSYGINNIGRRRFKSQQPSVKIFLSRKLAGKVYGNLETLTDREKLTLEEIGSVRQIL